MDIRLRTTAIEIVAADLAATLRFYRLLGLPIGDHDGPHVEVDLPGGNTLLFDTEDTIAGMHQGWTPPTGPGRVTIAFGLDSPGDVDALFGTIVGAGHRGSLEPFDAPWGQRYASVVDPDGTTVDLFAPLPG
ncbi:MAG: VOC family protein [Mycobacterium sp.]|nr:VOC family protein [Mycobacterium sp.]